MSTRDYSSVLFACDHNAVRSPMAEGLMKKFYGHSIYVQSAGLRHDMEIDGFTIAVCQEVGVELVAHRSRNFDELEALGEGLDGFDLIVALSPASHEAVKNATQNYSVEIDFWPIADPTKDGRTREEKLDSYRQVRDSIMTRIEEKFGKPTQ